MRSKARQGRPRLRVRRNRLRQLGRRTFGTTTDAALAAALGIDASGLSHLMTGQQQPSASTIAYLLETFDVEFEDLFERYSPTPTASPPTDPEAAVTTAA